ncbi:MAG: S9 family peptidase [Proteobacteria bacterium]|nr:S9 family peptidase [Pseudomonadota bacterium]
MFRSPGQWQLWRAVVLTLLLVASVPRLGAQAGEGGYQKAPPPIGELLSAPAAPSVHFNPQRDTMIIYRAERHPPVADLAEPALRLAGLRINPANNGPHRTARCVELTLHPVIEGKDRPIAIQPNARITPPSWAPDGRQFAFLRFGSREVELWVGDGKRGSVRRLRGAINATIGEAFQWMPDSQSIICQTTLPNRPKAPTETHLPSGPLIQESNGKVAPARTFQDLLESPHDEALFDYYTTSQLVIVSTKSGESKPVGTPGIFHTIDPSPNGQLLLVSRVQRPYSYQLPVTMFPREVEVLTLDGKVAFHLASLPLAEEVPIGGVRTGPRSYQWRPTNPATLVWVEALDGGDPRKKVPHRDRILMLEAPFAGNPIELEKTEHRFQGLTWTERPDVALVREYQASRRWTRTWLVNPNAPTEPARLLWDVSSQDRYSDPGTPLLRTLTNGFRVARVNDGNLFLVGAGASPDGERPFLDTLNLNTLRSERVFQSDEGGHESVVALLKPDAAEFITRREAPTRPANYFIRNLTDNSRKALTDFPDLMPQLRGIRKQLVTYQRSDGVALSFTLYLPADYQPGQRLPTILWAYPREFNDSDTAGQVTTTANRYTSFAGASHLFLVTQGYAVLDNATMPVIGESKKANDTFLEQIISSAKAAVDKAVEMGIADPARVGVGGHSYGAFMVANLMAHTDIFKAGVARSGAYNRTLTPFGFQNERRTLWEAPDIYSRMSPFMFAHRINEPLLLIHGEADNNPGTFPMQSERLYQAVKGNGGTARLVLLPHESHSYEARESVEHVLWETIHWFDKYVKRASAPPVTTFSPTDLPPP